MGAASAVLAFFATVPVARAAPALRIEWSEVPGCPESSVVMQHARRAIAGAKEADDVVAVAQIVPPDVDGGAWQLHIRTRTVRGAGERSLEAASCDAIARAAGMLVALASLRTRPLSTEQTLDELAPQPDRVDEGHVPALPLNIAEPRPERLRSTPEPVATSDTRFVPSTGIGVSAGLLPRIGVGPNFALGYETSWLRARAGVRGIFPQAETRWGLGAELSAVGASADVCGRLPVRAFLRAKTHACAGAIVDDIRARGIGAGQTFAADRTAMLLFAGLTAEWEIDRIYRVGVDVRAGGSLMRPRFVVESASAGEHELHRPSALRAEGSLTFGLAF